MQRSDRAVSELDSCHAGIFGLDLVKCRSCNRLHAINVAEKIEQQIDRVYTLIHQCSATVKAQRAPPFRIFVILRRAVPLHGSLNKKDAPKLARSNPIAQAEDVGFQAVLKDDSELDSGSPSRRYQIVCTFSGDIDWLLNQHMHAFCSRCDTLGCVNSGRASDNYQI